VLSPILFYISTIAAALFAEAYRQGIQEDQTSNSDDGAVVSAT
jgi:hypothetical protein